MIMKKENAKEFKGVNELEIGKDYVSVLYSKFIVIDRVGDFNNEAIYDDLYKKKSLALIVKLDRSHRRRGY